MMSADPPSEGQIFAVARTIQSIEAKLKYLDQVCGEDTVLRDHILRLLAEDKQDSFLGVPIAVVDDVHGLAEVEGQTVIGPYKLLQQIGEGGFGIVYMAEQQHPVRRKVALKVIKPGMDTKEVIGRFEVERQALAMMNHPNIAKVLDAGNTQAGRPFFVMELVKGIPITNYCDREYSSTRQRLELFVKVCQAVQHAHQKGIIHRDLKPSNVMVTEHDAIPVPKVIDFGVSKAINQQLTDVTVFTRFRQMIGTPMYMSPEQADLSGLDIDTRSDIYSLGVLLYELLTGATPFDRTRFSEVAFDEIRRVIREEEPPRPSTRIQSLSDTTSSSHRGLNPTRLSQLMRGDLDWVIMKAMDKDRKRRYETASSFGSDIQRYLDSVPVSAAAPSMLYRLRKFSRRNTMAIGVTTAITLTILIGLASTAYAYVREREARATAQHRRREADLARDDAKDARASEEIERLKKQAVQQYAINNERQLRQRQYAFDMNKAVLELERSNTKSVINLLKRHVPQNEQPDLRCWVWRYLWSATHQNTTMIATHGTGSMGIGSMAISPDQRSLVVAGEVGDFSNRPWQGSIKRIDLDSLQVTESFREIEVGPITKLNYTSKGDLVLDSLGRDKNDMFRGLGIYDVVASKTLRPFVQLLGAGWPTFMAPDGRWVVGTFRGIEIRMVTVDALEAIPKTGTAEVIIARLDGQLHFRGFDVVGERFADVSETELAESEDLRTVKDLLKENWNEPHPEPRCQDKIYVAVTKALGVPTHWNLHRLRSLDAKTGEELGKSMAVEVQWWNQHNRIRLSPDGRLMAVGCTPNQVVLLSVPEFEQKRSVDVGSHVLGLAWSSDSKLFAVALGPAGAEIRDATTGEVKTSLKASAGAPMLQVAFSDDGRLLAAVNRRSVVVSDVDTGATRDVFFQGDKVSTAIFLPGGKRLATGDRTGKVRIWDVSTDLATQGETEEILDAKYSPDGKHLAYVAGGVVRLLDAKSGKLVGRFESPENARSAKFTTYHHEFEYGAPICFSRDGTMLAAANADRTVTIYDVPARKPMHVLRGHTEPIIDLTFSPDSKRLATASRIEKVRMRLWDTATGELVPMESEFSNQALTSVDFSPDGKLLACGNRQVQIWSVEESKLLQTMPQSNYTPVIVRFSPDGQYLACGNANGLLRIHSLPFYEVVHEFEGLNRIVDLAFSADGINLLVVFRTGIVRILNLSTMSEVGDIFRSEDGYLRTGQFSSDGESLFILRHHHGIQHFRAMSKYQMSNGNFRF